MLAKLRSQSREKGKNQSLKKVEFDFRIAKNRVKSAFGAYNSVGVKKKSWTDRETKVKTASLNVSVTPTERTPGKRNRVEIDKEKRVKSEMKVKSYMNKSLPGAVFNEVLRAKSDILELKRDLATYELNFFQNLKICNLRDDFFYTYDKIFDSLSITQGIEKTGTDLSDQIKIICKNKKEPRYSGLHQTILIEEFPVKKLKNKPVTQNFQGIVKISSLRCILSVKTTYFSNHFISCLLPSGLTLTLHLKRKVFEAKCDPISTYTKNIKEKIFPFLHLNEDFHGLTLEFDEQYTKKFINFFIKLKGLNKKILLFVIDSGHNFIFTVKKTNFSLELEKLTFETQNFCIENLFKLKEEISNHLFLRHNSLVWGKNPFEVRERSSKFLKNRFLLEAFDENIKKIFSVRVGFKGKIFKLEGFYSGKEKFLKAFSSKSVVRIGEESEEFRIIFGLQHLGFFESPVTLGNSLELRIVFERIFNN